MSENLKTFENYIGLEMTIDEMVQIFIDKWVIAEDIGETEKLQTIGKVIRFFDTEKEMHLEMRRLVSNGDRRPTVNFRGKRGTDTPKSGFERIIDYEKY